MLVDRELTKYITKSKSANENANFKYPRDFYEKSSKEPDAHQFFSEFKPLLYALAAFGRFPFRRDSGNRLDSCLLSVGGFYWTVVYALTTIIAYDMLITSFTQIVSCHDIEDVLVGVRNLSFLLMHFLLPLNWLSEWQTLGRYINEWDEFLVDWELLTGRTLVAGLVRWCAYLTVACPIFSIGHIYYDRVIFAHNISGGFMYWHISCGGSIHSSMFILILGVAQRASDCLKMKLVDIVERSKNRTRISAVEIQKLKYLWVRTSDLLVKSGKAMGQSCLIIYLVNTCWTVVSLYGLVKTLVHFDLTKAFHHAYVATACSVYVLIGCEVGHRTTRKMQDDIIAALASIDVSGLNDLSARELNIFLQVVSIHQPVVVCAGACNMNRSYLTMACSHIITYLIVLVQFKTTNVDVKQSNITAT